MNFWMTDWRKSFMAFCCTFVLVGLGRACMATGWPGQGHGQERMDGWLVERRGSLIFWLVLVSYPLWCLIAILYTFKLSGKSNAFLGCTWLMNLTQMRIRLSVSTQTLRNMKQLVVLLERKCVIICFSEDKLTVGR